MMAAEAQPVAPPQPDAKIAALRQSLARETEHTWLAREAAIGYAQLESGQTVNVDSKEQFIDLVRSEP